MLVVEDSSSDIKMVLWALDRNRKGKSVVTLVDGDQVMAYLRLRDRPYPPDLIVLDLNLPKKDGWEVLAECKGDPALRAIPIVIFSTSRSESDVRRCLELGANSYVCKPYDLDAFESAIRTIEDYWLGLSVGAGPGRPGAPRAVEPGDGRGE
jgi:CheY-like chemotaxis protein